MSKKTWKAQPPTEKTLVEFHDDLIDLCRKHKVLAAAVVLQGVHKEKPGLYIQTVGEEKMIKLVRSKFGLPSKDQKPVSESELLANLRKAIEDRKGKG